MTEFDTPRADRAYCAMIDQAMRPECLGWEAKVRAGQFGESELKAHKKCGELYGRHVAYAECESEIAELKRSLAETTQERDALRSAILAAHPSGSDEGADPLQVVKTLGREWLDEVMRGPPQTIEFLEEDGTARKIVYESGDSSVGIGDGYLGDEKWGEKQDYAGELAAEAACCFAAMISDLYPGFDRQALDAMWRAMQDKYGAPTAQYAEAARRAAITAKWEKKNEINHQRDAASDTGSDNAGHSTRESEESRRGAGPTNHSLSMSADFLAAVKRLVIAGRTTGGTAGRDEGLCAALDAVEAHLQGSSQGTQR